MITNGNTRADYLRQMSDVWQQRCADMPLKAGTKTRQGQLEAFLQGVLASATYLGAMSNQGASMVAVLVASGRGEEVLAAWGKAV